MLINADRNTWAEIFLPVYDYLSRDDIEGQFLTSQIVGGNVNLGVFAAVVLTDLTFLRRQGFAAEHLMGGEVAAMYETWDRLLSILSCKLLLHKLGGILLKHAEVGQQNGKMDKIVVAVAVGKLTDGGLFNVGLRKGIDTLHGPV